MGMGHKDSQTEIHIRDNIKTIGLMVSGLTHGKKMKLFMRGVSKMD
jgi:hypothetical protein